MLGTVSVITLPFAAEGFLPPGCLTILMSWPFADETKTASSSAKPAACHTLRPICIVVVFPAFKTITSELNFTLAQLTELALSATGDDFVASVGAIAAASLRGLPRGRLTTAGAGSETA